MAFQRTRVARQHEPSSEKPRRLSKPPAAQRTDSTDQTKSTLDRVHDPRLSPLTRQSAVRSLGALHGNQYIQRAIAGSGRHATLRVGSRGAEVSALQEALNSAGAGLTVDGSVGRQTRQALVAFQNAQGLPADGIAGPQTWTRLSGGQAAPVGNGQPAQSGASGTTQASSIQAKMAQIGALLAKIKQTHQPTVEPMVEASTPTISDDNAAPSSAVSMAPYGMDDPDGEEGEGASISNLLGLDHLEEKAESVVGSAKSWVDDKVDSAVGAAKEAYTGAEDWLGDKANTVSDWAGGAESWLEDKAGAVGDWAGQQVNAAEQTFGEIKQAVQQTVSSVENEIGEFVGDLKTRYADEIAAIQQAIQDIGRGLYSPALEAKLNEILKSLGESGGDPQDGEPPPHNGTLDPIPNPVPMEAHACEEGAPPVQVVFDIQPEFSTSAGGAENKAHQTSTGTEHRLPVPHPWGMDAVDSSGLFVESSVVRGGLKMSVSQASATAVGYSEPQFSEMDSIAFSAHDNQIFASARLPISIHYDTDGGGRAEIPNADSPNIRADNWQAAVDALTPGGGGKYTNAPPLTGFWSPPITEAHEVVHTGQYKTLANEALDKEKPDLNKKQINGLPWFFWTDSDRQRVKDLLKIILNPVPGKVATTMNATYDDGRVGYENAAYGSTSAIYTKLVDDIKARATKEGWDKPKGKKKP